MQLTQAGMSGGSAGTALRVYELLLTGDTPKGFEFEGAQKIEKAAEPPALRFSELRYSP